MNVECPLVIANWKTFMVALFVSLISMGPPMVGSVAADSTVSFDAGGKNVSVELPSINCPIERTGEGIKVANHSRSGVQQSGGFGRCSGGDRGG